MFNLVYNPPATARYDTLPVKVKSDLAVCLLEPNSRFLQDPELVVTGAFGEHFVNFSGYRVEISYPLKDGVPTPSV